MSQIGATFFGAGVSMRMGMSAGLAGLMLMALSSVALSSTARAADAPVPPPTDAEARACFVSRWFSFDGTPCTLKYEIEDLTVKELKQKGKTAKLQLSMQLKVLSTQDRVCLPDHLGKRATLAINDIVSETRRISMKLGPNGWKCEGK